MYPPDNAPKPRYISRIEIANNTTAGWQVRFRRQGQHHSKFFSDSRYGDSKEHALKAAIQWRDHEILDQPTPIVPHEASANARQTITRGISIYNRRIERKVGKKRKRRIEVDYPLLQASWKDPLTGKRQGSCISVEKWGIRTALWKLINKRGDALDLSEKERLAMYSEGYSKAVKLHYIDAEPAGPKVPKQTRAYREWHKKQMVKRKRHAEQRALEAENR